MRTGLDPRISPSRAQEPLVVALDLGTSSVRALAFDALGRAVEGAEALTVFGDAQPS